ncbi:amino acid permease 3-like [Macadamia integrifolia]|uniref:amino acid permease 3-like n=1 Tax=Macadamia integrifolia TaxID=60698 RepID=UPI001C4E36D4|nr:amino acid permease 3-like [Macadamia integrifolia]
MFSGEHNIDIEVIESGDILVLGNLCGFKVKICGLIQYLNLFSGAIGYIIAASISMMAIKRSNCFHESKGKSPCLMSSNPHMIMFGIVEILFSQILDFDQIWWLSIVAAIMAFTYSTIGLGLGIAKVVETGKFMGSLSGISIRTITETQKIWRSFQALGDIAFAYSYSIILIEIQDTIKFPPSEAKTIKKATLLSVAVMTLFYMLCGCIGYATFGDAAPENFFTSFGFYNPYWLLDIANAAIVIHEGSKTLNPNRLKSVNLHIRILANNMEKEMKLEHVVIVSDCQEAILS